MSGSSGLSRRLFLKSCASAGAAYLSPVKSDGYTYVQHRVRPSDAGWPSPSAWSKLRDQVGGRLFPLQSPLLACESSSTNTNCQELFQNLKNPYFIRDSPSLTETLGWIDAWTSKSSTYVVAAENATDIAYAVEFARTHQLRLVVKGAGHSYMGNSNSCDSLLIWTRKMTSIELHESFVPSSAPSTSVACRAVSLGAGAIWEEAYEAVTTKAGLYVQGGGCTTVGVAGLIQGGGFGSYSKYFGLASSSLLEAEVITADSKIRTVNAYQEPDLFWALKGGGGGTFGVVSRVTLQLHPLPEFCGRAVLTVKANSDAGFVGLLRRFVDFYADHLFNPNWGESAQIAAENVLHLSLMFVGLNDAEVKNLWSPLLSWLAENTDHYSILSGPDIRSQPMRHVWDADWNRQHRPTSFVTDPREGNSGQIWWSDDTSQTGFVIWDYDSVWLPASLLQHDQRDQLVSTLFQASRHTTVSLHFNKGLAGASTKVLEEARKTPMNPVVCNAFALAIVVQGQEPAYPGVPGHEPDLAEGRRGAERVRRTIQTLRLLAPDGGAYVSEASFFGNAHRLAYWGENHERLARIKDSYDPDCLFFVHHGVGSERWSEDGFTRLA